MPSKHPFSVYNASAGSGKTFTLVKEYLKILFESERNDHFKRILAITFTNKAVAEMKERIVDTLKDFADEAILSSKNDMFKSICNELKLEPGLLHEKSKAILNTIMHNYASFDISTIDGFTHKIIRTFAHDLKLPLNFEVELDQEALLNEAVDSLIAKAGSDEALTNVLVDFAIEKADDDKSWDVTLDFNKIANLLVKENDIGFIETLKHKTLEDFNALKKQLIKEIKTLETQIIETGSSAITLIQEAGLDFKDFNRGSLPKYFENLSNKNFDVSFDNNWQETIETSVLYPKRVSGDVASTINNLQPQLAQMFKLSKTGIFHLKFLKAFYKNITPLSVLNIINKELQLLKAEQNKMLISEFNTIISQEIKNQPTPFIYERLGEKFKHYFIDEFQDTSMLQWQNLIPLIDNALSTENGTAMLVGDAKQAIYRWRGGKAEQFIDLFNDANPFQIEKQLEKLPTNYRSFKEVVTFNNGFFNFLANEAFSNQTHRNLYENASQEINKNSAGYVDLLFIDCEKEDDKTEIYCEEVLKTIKTNLDSGYKLSEICVIVRKKKDGVAVAKYLSKENIPIVSSETLLLNNAPEVAFTNNILTLLLQPKNNQVKVKILDYLSVLFHIENKHDFFVSHLNLPLEKFFTSFEAYNVYISSKGLTQMALYDLVETIVRSFNLIEKPNAYIQFYLDIVLEFTQKKGSDIRAFLDYFEKKKDSLCVVSPKGQNAVQIMTIHKSKGLEFPVVIFPFAELEIYREIEPKEWFPVDKDVYNGFSHTLLNYNSDFEKYGDVGIEIHQRHQSELELDNLNLLYVALTRAVEQLYIISSKDITTKGDANAKKYSGLFINYLQNIGVWTDSQIHYTFGAREKTSESKFESRMTSFQNEFISTAKETHNINIITKSGLLWDTNQELAIEKGNLVHNILAKINSSNDIEPTLNEFVFKGIINNKQSQALKPIIQSIVSHPELSHLFNEKHIIFNERDIITKSGEIIRPDRLVFTNDKTLHIIDYKTGLENSKHINQILQYKDVLQGMNYSVESAILVYINQQIQIIEV